MVLYSAEREQAGVYLKLQVPRVMCRACSIVRQITLGFADARRTYTIAFQRHVVELSKNITILDVAQHLKSAGTPSKKF
jgi:hypothetical protein